MKRELGTILSNEEYGRKEKRRKERERTEPTFSAVHYKPQSVYEITERGRKT
jgi:hypothetical protein